MIVKVGGRDVHVEIDGVRVRFVAVGTPLTDGEFAQLNARKREILRALLEQMRHRSVLPPSVVDWPEDQREAYEERAAIIEYDGGLDRVDAEVLAEICVRGAR